jgi:phosphate transport system permease protein
MAQAVTAGRITAEVLRGNPARLRRERRMRGLFFAAAFLSVLISVGIVLSLLGGTIDFLRKVDLSTLWSDGWLPRNNLFDIKTIVAGTLIVALIAMVVAAPLGLGAALYLSEYATPRARRYLKPILETLASIPSVVLGYFAIRVISPELVQRLFGSQVPLFNMLAAGIAVGLLVTPLVASVAGGTGGSLFNLNPLEGGQTMTAAIAALATGSDQVRGAGAAYSSLFFVGLLLFLITLGLNLVSERFVRRVRKRF